MFALLTALANGTASVLQRRAAADAPQSKALRLSLFGYLIRRKVWLAGIATIIVAAVCQATALATGPVALVQPIFIIELPFSLLLATRLSRHPLPRLTWWAVARGTASLGAGLAAAAPSGGTDHAPLRVWAVTLIVTAGFGVRAGRALRLRAHRDADEERDDSPVQRGRAVLHLLGAVRHRGGRPRGAVPAAERPAGRFPGGRPAAAHPG